MVCPKCGAEMAEGHLYCEKCGAEVQIVPVFEPELEESIRDAMLVMAKDVAAVEAHKDADGDQDRKKPGSRQGMAGVAAVKKSGFFRKHRRWILAAVCGALVLTALTGAVFAAVRNQSYAYQISQAVRYQEEGDYGKALPYLEKAVDLEADNPEGKFLLAKAYANLENPEGAVLLLNEVVSAEPGNESAYKLMIGIYEKQGKFDQIDKLLKKSENVKIRQEFASYMALPPKFSQEEGIYQEKVSLRIMADTEGEIYYNLEGRPAGKDSLKYRGPLELGEGTHVISAVFVSAYGIVSESVTKTYEIELLTPEKPSVFPSGGVYTRPIYIRVEVPENCEVYYTVDGSIPTQESFLYDGPLAMPMGESLFSFVAVSEYGKIGEVTYVKYNLSMNTSVTAQAAELAIKTMMIAKGRIIDYEGHVPDLSTVYDYRCTAAVAEGARNYYIVQERKGNRETGNIYAVDAGTGDLYEAVYNSVGKFEFKYFF